MVEREREEEGAELAAPVLHRFVTEFISEQMRASVDVYRLLMLQDELFEQITEAVASTTSSSSLERVTAAGHQQVLRYLEEAWETVSADIMGQIMEPLRTEFAPTKLTRPSPGAGRRPALSLADDRSPTRTAEEALPAAWEARRPGVPGALR